MAEEEQEQERIARLADEYEALLFDEREAFLGALPAADRDAVLDTESRLSDEQPIPDDEELAGEA